jgi:hypothetical protein
VNEATQIHKKGIHLPRILISARQEIADAKAGKREINWGAITKDDPAIKSSGWYVETATPRTSPGPVDWWLEVRRAMATREADDLARKEEKKLKRERDDEESTDEGSTDEEEEKTERREEKGKGRATEADVRPSRKGKERRMEHDIEDAESEERDEPTEKKATGKVKKTEDEVTPSVKVKGKGKGKGKSKEMVTEEVMSDTDQEVVPTPSGNKKRKSAPTIAADSESAKSAKRMKLRPADDMTMQPGESDCTRCIRLGRTCKSVEGQSCTSCRKSKVCCPLTRRSKSRAPSRAPSRRGSVAPARLPSPVDSGPSSPITTFPSPPPSAPVASSSRLPADEAGASSRPDFWDDGDEEAVGFHRVQTFSIAGMRAPRYRPPPPPATPKKKKGAKSRKEMTPVVVDTKPTAGPSGSTRVTRARSQSRPPARTPTLITEQPPPPASSRGRAAERAPSAGPVKRNGRSQGKPTLIHLRDY